MKKMISLLSFLFINGFIFAQSAKIEHPEFGYVWTKAQQDPAFTRNNGDFNLQGYFTDYFTKKQPVPPGFNGMVILTFIVNKKGDAFFSKAFSSDPKIDLEPLQLKKCIDQMPEWLPATESGEYVNFQIMCSLKFENNVVSVRRMKF